MRIGVLSDTHDRLPMIDAAMDRFRAVGVDTLVHAGDVISPFAAKRLAQFPGTLHVVYGNNDGERAGLNGVLPQIQDGPIFLDLGGRRVLVHHALDWCHDDQLEQADVVVAGHTHEVEVRSHGKKLMVNPGECCGWVTGRCTIAVVDLDRLEAEIIELST